MLVSNPFTQQSKKKKSIERFIIVSKTARMALFKYIESWYNRKRIHGSIGYVTPDAYEKMCRAA